MLDRPLEPVIGLAAGETRWRTMTIDSAAPSTQQKTRFYAPRRGAPEILPNTFAALKPEGAGNAGCPMHPQPHARYGVEKYAHEYSQRKHRKHPASPTQWFTAYSALSPGTNCFVDPVIRATLSRLRGLDACKGAPEPHGFAVRKAARSSVALLASTASRPTFVTIASRPSWQGGMATANHTFPKNGSRIFFARGLDRNSRMHVICPSLKLLSLQFVASKKQAFVDPCWLLIFRVSHKHVEHEAKQVGGSQALGRVGCIAGFGSFLERF
jgi:hypothetical protein